MAIASTSAFAQLAVSTLAGSGSAGYANNTGTLATFSLSNPSGVAVDSSGNLYIADTGNNAIRKITPGGVVTTFAGSATGVAGSANGSGTAASFTNPRGISIDGAGNLYVADTGNNLIRMITSAGLVSTLAGSVGLSGSADGADTVARFNSPFGIAAERSGAAVNVYIADSQNFTIRKLVVATKDVTTIAGTAGAGGSTNAVGTAARFLQPNGIVLNTAGTILYVADRGNHLIRQIALTGGTPNTVTTLAGTGSSGSVDSSGTSASFNNPSGIGMDTGGNILVADSLNHTIRSITTAGAVSTIAGSALISGSSNGISTSARFNNPAGVTADAGGIYIVDATNQLIRKMSAVSAPSINGQPVPASASIGGTATFTVTATGNPPVSYQWQRQPGGTGSFADIPAGSPYSGVTGATLTVSPVAAAMNGDRFQVLVSNGVGSSATSSAAGLTVTQPPVFTSPTSQNFVVGQSTNFQVTATGSPTPTITAGSLPSWLIFNGTTNTLTATPSGTDTNATVTFTATNTINSAPVVVTQTFNANVVTTTVPSLVGPTAQSLSAGTTTAQFSVTATGSPATFTYQWQRRRSGEGAFSNITDGVIDSATFSGATTATLSIFGVTPAMNGDSYQVIVTNSPGSSSTSSPALLNVAPVFTSLSNTTFVHNQFGSFTFTANGNPAPNVTAVVNGTLPNGVTLSGNTISGIPSDTFNSVTSLTVTAANSGGTTQQAFTLSVTPPQTPFITSESAKTFSVNQADSFTFTASGAPTPTIQIFGTLPAGLTFNSPTLSGTPTSAEGSPFIITVQAQNSAGVSPSQTFTITVLGVAPQITTQPVAATANVGQSVTFTAAANGTPTPALRWQRQPSGTSGFINLSDDGVYSGTTTTTLTINAVSSSMSLDQYRLVASNGTPPEAQSMGAQLIVNVGTLITTVAGQAAFPGVNDGQGNFARFSSPSGLAADLSGNIYIADTANHVIRKMSPSGVVTTLAGAPGISGSVDGTGNAARFNSPQGVAVDGIGNIYVADTFNHTIRMITSFGSVSTLAGTAGVSGAVDGVGAAARFFAPTALVVDAGGNIYVADTSNHVIRRITSGNNVGTFAGLFGSAGHVEGVGPSARFSSPGGLAIDTFGTLYVADSQNQVIRKVNSGGGTSPLAGFPGAAGITDGLGTAARFNRPTGIAVDSVGNVYVADTLSSTLRKITVGGDVTTAAGLAVTTGTADGAGNVARFNLPGGVTIDLNGNIYIADSRNHTIRRSGSAQPPLFSAQPTSKVAGVGQSVTFTATATGTPAPGYQWQRASVDTFGSFVNLFDNGIYAGSATSSLTINGVTAAMNGDQFRVIINNGVPPVATSDIVNLTIGVAPVFTSPTSTEFRAGVAGNFRNTVTSDTGVTFSATGLPSWASINSSTGEITGTPPNTEGSPFTVVVTAANPATATQTITITVTPATTPPVITNQPASASADIGGTVTFAVAVTGTSPFTYQWRRDGNPIGGATNSTYTLNNIQAASAGVYSVAIGNVVTTVVSNGATLTVNSAPVIVNQPRAQVATLGSSATFTVSVLGSNVSYQWRRNGVAIVGAQNSTLTLNSVSSADAGNYDVQVSNAAGSLASSLAQLSIVGGPTAPVITSQPANRTVLAGTSVTLFVGASATPAATYQWYKNGGAVGGANGPSLTISNAQPGDSGAYDVVVGNAAGQVRSSAGTLSVVTRIYAGVYFGSFGGGLGNFAIFIREDNTGVFLGYLPGSTAPIMSLAVTLDANGSFSFTQNTINTVTDSVNDTEPSRAAALGFVSVNGSIGSDGAVTGSVGGAVNTSVTGTRASAGATQNLAGFYQAGSSSNGAVVYTIAGPDGAAFAVAQSGSTYDGGNGVVVPSGLITVNTGRSSISETATTGGSISGSVSGAFNATVSGGSDTLGSLQRLVNISSRARVTSGDAVAIAGFVISGTESKPVLIRGVGPTLGSVFSVPGALATPRLELFRGNTSLAVSTSIVADRAAIDAAGNRVGAFTLGTAGTDTAIVTTLAPGNYTAVVSSTGAAAGVALIEVYDLSAATPGQKLLNISTRATAGTAENVLTAGFVVPAGSAKRVLVRGVGPGLAAFGVTGTLAQPALTLLNAAGGTVAANTGVSTSQDAAVIATASTSVGAFGLATGDSAVIVTLTPGNYTAQVAGVGGATGVALIEVYELP
ncbi:MAG: immunoglobulin domain-containing protein [Verrucomicrobiota bacterium]